MRNARKEPEFVKLWTERVVVLSKRLENGEDRAENVGEVQRNKQHIRIIRLEDEMHREKNGHEYRNNDYKDNQYYIFFSEVKQSGKIFNSVVILM